MNHHQKNFSVWQDVKTQTFGLLTDDIQADVCVVGAGISGLTTAYLLLKEGRRVAVFEKMSNLGEGETGFTSAQLSNALDEGYAKIKKWHGKKGARLAYESHTEAIDQIEKIIREEKIDCDFLRVSGYLFLGPKDNLPSLQKELAVCREIGFTNVQMLHRAPVDSFDSGPCLHFPQQAQFHPLKYLQGLAQAIEQMGGKIYLDTQAIEVKGGDSAFVSTDRGYKCHCSHIVIATNVPINNRFAIHTKEAAYRSYMLGIRIPHGTIQPVFLWDTENPYHYVRVQIDPEKKQDILLVGGEDHRTGRKEVNEVQFASLRKWTQEVLNLKSELPTDEMDTQANYQAAYQNTFQWSGQIVEPVDGLAYIGHNPDDDQNIYIATGDSGHGLTHGTIAGLLLRDLILDRPNPWKELYNPKRISYKRLMSYFKDNINTSAQYIDWVSGGEDDPIFNLHPDEGTVVRLGLGKVAVYCDRSGNMQFLSAVCPHLGGVVHWNSLEKTWDCPCHGSRFNTLGQPINGPANENLKVFEAVKTGNSEDVAAML